MTHAMTQAEPADARELAGILSAYTEVTERLQNSHSKLTDEVSRLREELAHKNRQLERRSRLAALGEMAAGIAHEIRNPLGGIALYVGLLSKQLTDRPEARDRRPTHGRAAHSGPRVSAILPHHRQGGAGRRHAGG